MIKHALIGTLLSTLLPFSVAAETITIAADEWCPYNCSPESKLPGFMIEIARAAFKKHQIDVAYKILPWSRAVSATRKNNYTAIVGATAGDAPDFIFPAYAQGLSIMGFYTDSDDSWKYENMYSLSSITLGVISDYSYSDEVDAYIEAHKKDRRLIQPVSGENALELNVKKLRNKRIDAIIEDVNVLGNFLTETNQESVLREAGILDYRRGYQEQLLYVAFNPKNPKSKEYARILGDETLSMRKSGELQQILDKYGLHDWKELAE